jgi:hypothetical protein
LKELRDKMSYGIKYKGFEGGGRRSFAVRAALGPMTAAVVHCVFFASKRPRHKRLRQVRRSGTACNAAPPQKAEARQK